MCTFEAIVELMYTRYSICHVFVCFYSLYFRTQVCCGTIFKGMNGEVLVDPTLLKPCWSCGKNKSRNNNNNSNTTTERELSHSRELTRSTSLEDTDSNSSTPIFSVADFYEGTTPEPETPPDSPPDSPKHTLTQNGDITQLQQCSTKMNFVTSHSISMECWSKQQLSEPCKQNQENHMLWESASQNYTRYNWKHKNWELWKHKRKQYLIMQSFINKKKQKHNSHWVWSWKNCAILMLLFIYLVQFLAYIYWLTGI